MLTNAIWLRPCVGRIDGAGSMPERPRLLRKTMFVGLNVVTVAGSWLLEVEENVDGVIGFVGLNPVPDVFVVHRETAKDVRRFGFQLG